MHYIIYIRVVWCKCVRVCRSLRPKRVFAFLGHSHYHNIMTMISYCIWSYNDRNNIKLVVASYIYIYIYIYIYSMIWYDMILRRSLYIYGCSRFPPKSTLSFTARSVYYTIWYTFPFSTEMKISISSSSSLHFGYYKN
jgi:hypothetical protein